MSDKTSLDSFFVLKALREEGQLHTNVSAFTRWSLLEKAARKAPGKDGQPHQFLTLTLTIDRITPSGIVYGTVPNDKLQRSNPLTPNKGSWDFFCEPIYAPSALMASGVMRQGQTYAFLCVGNGTKTSKGRDIRYVCLLLDERPKMTSPRDYSKEHNECAVSRTLFDYLLLNRYFLDAQLGVEQVPVSQDETLDWLALGNKR